MVTGFSGEAAEREAKVIEQVLLDGGWGYRFEILRFKGESTFIGHHWVCLKMLG